MTLPVVFRRSFRNDLAAGYDWYEAQRPGVGEEFLAAVRATVDSMQAHAAIFAAVHGDVRRAMVPRFPFSIFYLVEPTRIVGLRILHTARDPKVWPRPRG